MFMEKIDNFDEERDVRQPILFKGREVLAITGLVALQLLSTAGCVGKIKPSRPKEPVAANTKCKEVSGESVNAVNVGSKINCKPVKKKKVPPKEGVTVLKWH